MTPLKWVRLVVMIISLIKQAQESDNVKPADVAATKDSILPLIDSGEKGKQVKDIMAVLPDDLLADLLNGLFGKKK